MSTQSRDRQSAVFIWRDRGLFLGARSETALHDHHAVEVSLALDDLGVSVSTEDREVRGAPAVVVRSDAKHRIVIHGPTIAMLYLEPRSAMAVSLSERLAAKDIVRLEAEAVAPLRHDLRALLAADATLEGAARVVEKLAARLGLADAPARIDARLVKLLRKLERRLDDPPTQAEAAQIVGVSASRLAHLFPAHIGMPMRRYMLWLRLRFALTRALGGASMADAAHAAGFSDAAHFTRTCQRMFGLPPSAFSPAEAVFVERDQFVEEALSAP